MSVCNKCVTSFAVLGLIAVMLTSCGGGGGGGTATPVANAGPDQNVLVGSMATLDASGSTGLVSSITWTFTSKPLRSAAALSSTIAIKPTFTADKAGSYVLSLRIGNGSVMSSPDTVTVKAVNTRAIPDTGQTTCYAADNSVISCLGSGQDAAYNLISQPSYSDPGDGTIIDNVTNLMWQKCTAFQSGPTCTGGTPAAYTWYEAAGTADAAYNPGGVISACSGTILGHTDWRLPTDFELMTIADYGIFSKATNSMYFPATSEAFYWTSTGSFIDPYAWSMGFFEGTTLTLFKFDSSGVVRCVRGEQSAPVLKDNNDGTITDKASGLIWQKQDGGAKTWVNALSYCEALVSAGSSSWRVPNIKELRSIADTTKYGPSINTVYFPGTAIHPYWSSTTVARFMNQAWTVDFNNGSVDNTVSKTIGSYVRCVR